MPDRLRVCGECDETVYCGGEGSRWNKWSLSEWNGVGVDMWTYGSVREYVCLRGLLAQRRQMIYSSIFVVESEDRKKGLRGRHIEWRRVFLERKYCIILNLL